MSDATFSRISIPHIGFSPDKVVAASVELAAHVPSLMDGISRMKSLSLTEGEQVAFAEAATLPHSAILFPHRSVPLHWFSHGALKIRPMICGPIQHRPRKSVKGGQKDCGKRKADGSQMPRTRAVKGIDGT